MLFNRPISEDLSIMKTSLFIGMALIAAGCATVTPTELTTARASYARASSGPAVQLVPAELHKAKGVLDAAEASFAEEKGSPKTVDLAYIADRTIQVVEAQAQMALAEQTVAKAKQDYQDKQAESMKKTQTSLAKTRQQLTDARRGQAQEAEQLGVEHAARQEADTKAAASEQRALASEQKTTEANEALAKLAAKEEARGLVITLSGGVLFRSNQATLLPGATTRLDEVAVALIANGQPVGVEGYTDARGSQSRNMDLSQRRAEAVRDYLISRGLPAQQVVAKGMGPERPIADNTSAEGRANNRRVEIVVSKAAPPAPPSGN
jgi:outer membrane protein OmpA-like peptidoglycan-associated protein